MKLLVADVGNTSTAVGIWNDGRVSGVKHIDGGGKAAVAAAKTLLGRSKFDAFAYVSVVPEEDSLWRRFARNNAIEMRTVSWKGFPLRLDYPKPETIGADRLADAAGAVEKYGAPTIVMDFGTALTAAAITSDGVWRGGAIAPGFPLMRDYLFERTAKLPRMKLWSGRVPKIGRSTEQAMRFGALVGYRGMVREIYGQLRKNFNEDFRPVATGGFAKWVLGKLDIDFTIDPTLTLYGAGLLCSRRFRF